MFRHVAAVWRIGAIVHNAGNSRKASILPVVRALGNLKFGFRPGISIPSPNPVRNSFAYASAERFPRLIDRKAIRRRVRKTLQPTAPSPPPN